MMSEKEREYSPEELECPLTGVRLSVAEARELDRKQELVRQQCVEEFSSSPLYQARAAKDPNYWRGFSMGRAHLYTKED